MRDDVPREPLIVWEGDDGVNVPSEPRTSNRRSYIGAPLRPWSTNSVVIQPRASA